VAQIRDTSSTPAISFQDLIQPSKVDRPRKRKKRRGKKLLTFVILVGLLGGVGYYFRNAAPVRKLLGHEQPVAPLPDVPFVRPSITTAEYSVTTSAVQNGVPNNVTTKVMADYITGTGQSTVESQTGGAFTTTEEIRTREFAFHPGGAIGSQWTRQPRVPETPSPYDAVEFIPMVDDIIDQPFRAAHIKPTSAKSTGAGEAAIITLTYVLDRASVPEVAPAIFARLPWLFDVPNAKTLTIEVGYDQSGVVHHLHFGVDPPQPGTGIDATWVTGYTLDVTSLNVPVAITVPIDAVDVPVGTP
jgi:hypothetical protein